MKTGFANFFRGIFIGTADLIPGISGITISIALGIYDKLIESINNIFTDFKRNFIFLFPILLGAAFGIVTFSSMVEYCMKNYQFQTFMFIIGLICGIIPLIYGKATTYGFKVSHVIPCTFGFFALVVMSFLKDPTDLNADIVINTSLLIKFFIGGIISATALIIPGISGSFVMVMLGIYPAVIRSLSSIKMYLIDVTNLDILIEILAVLVPMGLGIVIGIILASKIIAIFLKRAYSVTYFVILGLIIGSVFGILKDLIFVYSKDISSSGLIMGVVMLIIGLISSIFLGKE